MSAPEYLSPLQMAQIGVRPDRERLQEIVEVDEIYVGGEEAGATGRNTETKAVVAVAVEIVGDRKLGRVRLRSVRDAGASSLEPFVREVIEGSRGPA